MNERMIQQRLMSEVIHRKKHIVAVPNSQYLLLTEADLLSITRARLVHEYEIKCSKSDYNREFKSKVWKHMNLKNAEYQKSHSTRCPNYFWFVTHGFEAEVPAYAGHIEVYEINDSLLLRYKKEAPRLHNGKWSHERVAKTARLLSFRLLSEWSRNGNN